MVAPRDDEGMVTFRDDEGMVALRDDGECWTPDDDAQFVTASAAWQSIQGSPRRNGHSMANIALAKGFATPRFHFHFQLRSTT